MYFSLLKTISVISVCSYLYKKRREIKKTGKYNNRYNYNACGLGDIYQASKVAFFMLFQMVIGALGIFPHRIFFYKQFYDFPTVFCISRLPFAWSPIIVGELGTFPLAFHSKWIDTTYSHVFLPAETESAG